MEARTIASLTWRLDHGTLALSDRHVLIVDKSGMTPDVDLGRLLGAVERSGAKIVVVGDDRQLGAIGPGDGLRALKDRHPERVWALTDNLRQTDPGERAALVNLRDGNLRDGNLAVAVSWYRHDDRIHPVADRRRAVLTIVRAWAADTARGKDTLMVAYRRDNVEALSAAARALFDKAGLLTGPELTAPGGRTYRAGDRVITLAPGPQGAWVTSQAAEVIAVDPDNRTLTAVTADGDQLKMGPDDLGADRLGYGYAITAHRAQGATVDVAHVLDGGGGRELAYVAMSRARQESHVYVAAGNLSEAVERLAWSWGQERRQEWVTDRARLAELVAEVRAERDRLVGSIPPDVTDQLARLRDDQAALDRDIADLQSGTGRWAETPVRPAYDALRRARQAHDDNVHQAHDPHQGILARNHQAVEVSASSLHVAEAAWEHVIEPHADQLAVRQTELAGQADQLQAAQRARAEFIAANPEIVSDIQKLMPGGRSVDQFRVDRSGCISPIRHLSSRRVASAAPCGELPVLRLSPGFVGTKIDAVEDLAVSRIYAGRRVSLTVTVAPPMASKARSCLADLL